jgi:hypothetical protein
MAQVEESGAVTLLAVDFRQLERTFPHETGPSLRGLLKECLRRYRDKENFREKVGLALEELRQEEAADGETSYRRKASAIVESFVLARRKFEKTKEEAKATPLL